MKTSFLTWLSLLLLFSFSRSLQAQEIRCVPVVYHKIYNTDTGKQGWVDDGGVYSNLQRLNDAFRGRLNPYGVNGCPVSLDSHIEFFLATQDKDGVPCTGIETFPVTSAQIQTGDVIDPSINSIWTLLQPAVARFPVDQYLNIFVYDLSSWAGHGYTGQPDERSQGVLNVVYIDWSYFGANSTVAHEAGHWLMLEHPASSDPCIIINNPTIGVTFRQEDINTMWAALSNYYTPAIHYQEPFRNRIAGDDNSNLNSEFCACG